MKVAKTPHEDELCRLRYSARFHHPMKTVLATASTPTHSTICHKLVFDKHRGYRRRLNCNPRSNDDNGDELCRRRCSTRFHRPMKTVLATSSTPTHSTICHHWYLISPGATTSTFATMRCQFDCTAANHMILE